MTSTPKTFDFARRAIRRLRSDPADAWLRLEGEHPTVDDRPPAHGADVVLVLPPDLLGRFWQGSLPMEVLRGNVAYDGPVRRVLQVFPVMRAAAKRSEAVAA